MILWEAGNPCPAEVLPSEDSNWLQDMGAGIGIGFSRLISSAGPKYLADRYRSTSGSKPPHIDHDSIEEAFIEKGSSVHYCHQGEWLELAGSD